MKMHHVIILMTLFIIPNSLFSSSFSDIVTEVIESTPSDKKLIPMKTALLFYLRDNATGSDRIKLEQALGNASRKNSPDTKDFDFNPYLGFAIFLDCQETVEYFVDQGFHYTKEGELSDMPILVATVIGNLDLMKYFTEQGCTPKAFKESHPVDFLLEAETYFLDKAKKKNDKEEQKNIRTRYGRCMKYLLELCEPFDCTRYKHNPLEYTVRNEMIEEMEILLNAGFPVDSCGDKVVPMVFTAFHTENPDLLRKMLEMGVDPNAVDRWGNNVIHEFVIISLSDPDRKTSVYHHHEDEMMDVLLMFGVDINHRNNRSETPLDDATYYENMKIITLLLENGATIGEHDAGTVTPIHWAVLKHNMDMLTLFLETFPNVINIKDKEGNTPLHKAIESEDIDMVHYLLQRHADSNIKNRKGVSPMHVAVKKGFQKAANFLLQAGANINSLNKSGDSPIFIAAKNNDLDMLKWFIEQGADTSIKNCNGNTLLDSISSDDVRMKIKDLLKKKVE